MSVPNITLNDGNTIPQLGFGVFQMDPEQTEDLVAEALRVGYRHIDTAAIYGNEEGVGKAIANSGIPREELFVTTKLRNGEQATARAAFETSLEQLGLDRVDLYLVHWPAPGLGTYREAWADLEQGFRDGLARAIGVSNFLPHHLRDLLQGSTVVPAVNQIETHPFFQRADYQAEMAELGVQIQSWGPFAEGRNNLFTNPTLTAIADRHGVSVAQVVLRWLTNATWS